MTNIERIFAGVAPQDSFEVLSRAVSHFGSSLCMAISFQLGGLVLLDMLYKMGKPVRVFSIDTGRIPEETFECAETVFRKYGIKVAWVFPQFEAVQKLETDKGLYSFRESVENRKECCRIRKIEPLDRALEGYNAWITGRRKDQGKTRSGLKFVEQDPVHSGLVKINPLINWTKAELQHYIEENDVPYHQLYNKGYLSIGCAPCTRPCSEEEDERVGRWWWELVPEQKECGLHFNFKNGGGI